MDLGPVVQRVVDCVPAARRARFAISLPAALQDAAAAGTGELWVYVVPGTTSPERNDAAGAVMQQVPVSFSVVVVVKNVRDSRGDAANDQLNGLLRPLRKALQGWAPPWANEPIQLGRGRIAGFSDFVSVWQEDFLTGYLESNEETT